MYLLSPCKNLSSLPSLFSPRAQTLLGQVAVPGFAAGFLFLPRSPCPAAPQGSAHGDLQPVSVLTSSGLPSLHGEVSLPSALPQLVMSVVRGSRTCRSPSWLMVLLTMNLANTFCWEVFYVPPGLGFCCRRKAPFCEWRWQEASVPAGWLGCFLECCCREGARLM